MACSNSDCYCNRMCFDCGRGLVTVDEVTTRLCINCSMIRADRYTEIIRAIKTDTPAWQEEPYPIARPDRKPIVDTVIEEFQAKADAGQKKYGTKLTSYNGRRPLRDLYQELMDAVLYIRQAIEEEESGNVSSNLS